MASKAIRPKRDDGPLASGWESIRESAPSATNVEQHGVSRLVALAGLMVLALGGAAVGFAAAKRPYLIDAGWGMFFVALGTCALLYHAFGEKELQYRRLYAALGLLLWVVGVGLRLIPSGGQIGGLWLPYGSPAFLAALGFLGAFARNETDEKVRTYVLNVIGLTGLALSLIGGGYGFFNENFLVTHGLVSLVLGLFYLATFVGLEGSNSRRGYLGGWGIGILGGVMFAAALIRSAGPTLLYWVHLRNSAPMETFFVPSGLLLMYLGLEFLMVGVGFTSDRPLVVLTRREVASFFYSPIAYVVIAGTTAVGWFMFVQFAQALIAASDQNPMSDRLAEPIVRYYVFALFPVICVIFIVPVLTMRLLSEERRSGTLEVLLTAPVNEGPVVLSKFFAAFRVFMLAWIPWGLFLVALRVEGGQEFDYRPLLGFFIVLAVNGAGFLAMGLFFSALTRNQIAAAILTFVGMLLLTFVIYLKNLVPEESPWATVLTYVSYIDLWGNTLQGTLAPRFLVFYLSGAAFWLFLTAKVLESRKWS